jgi:hypothetical protein
MLPFGRVAFFKVKNAWPVASVTRLSDRPEVMVATAAAPGRLLLAVLTLSPLLTGCNGRPALKEPLGAGGGAGTYNVPRGAAGGTGSAGATGIGGTSGAAGVATAEMGVAGGVGAGGSSPMAMPQGASFSSIALGNGVFLAAGYLLSETGLIYRSTDGLSWSPALTNEQGLFTDVKFGNGRFVALLLQASGSVIPYVSNDGTSWTTAVPPDPVLARRFAFGAGMFVMSAKDGFLSSSDGMSWTLSPGGGPETGGITFGANHFVGWGTGGSVAVLSGDTWRDAVVSDNAVEIDDLSADKDELVAITHSSVFGTDQFGKARSTDGITWTSDPIVQPSSQMPFRVLVDTDSACVANESSELFSGPDCNDLSPTFAAGPFLPAAGLEVNGLFIVVGQGILTSPDAHAWTRRVEGE